MTQQTKRTQLLQNKSYYQDRYIEGNFRELGLLKYDCPSIGCGAWFVTLHELNVACKDCCKDMICSSQN